MEKHVTEVQKKFRNFLAVTEVQDRKFTEYKNKRLNELYLRQKGRQILFFLKDSVLKLKYEREEAMRQEAFKAKRRKAVLNNEFSVNYRNSKIIKMMPGGLMHHQSKIYDSIPSIYCIYRIKTNKRPLTAIEKFQQPTESSCSRFKQINIRRNSPKPRQPSPRLRQPCHAKSLEKIKESNKKKFEHVESKLMEDTVCSFNRNHSVPHPPTPDFARKPEKPKKIRWNFLKSTVSFEQHTMDSLKTTNQSTFPTRNNTPNISHRPTTAQIHRNCVSPLN